MSTGSPPIPVPGQLLFFDWYPAVPFNVELGAGGFTDPQGLAMTYSASLASGGALPSWISFDPATGTFSGTAPSSYQSQPGSMFTVTLTATDSAGLSASEGVQVQIYPVLPPSQSNFIPTVHVLPGHSFSSRMPADAFSDPQGLPMTYSASQGNGSALPSWLSFNPATLTFAGTAPSNLFDNYTVQFHATDSAGQTGTAWFTIYFNAGPPNLSVPTADQSWTVGQAINFTLPSGSFTDPQNEALSYSITGANGQQLPSWLQFNAHSLTFSGTPPSSSAGTSLGIEVTATDTDNLSTSETINIVFAAQAAPKLSLPTPAQSWSLGQSVNWILPAGTFTDPQGLALTYTAKSGDGSPLPSWLKFNPTTLTLSGTTPNISASLSLEVDATNSAGAITGDLFTATIGQPNPNASPPNLTDPTVGQVWVVGTHISLTLAADTFTDPQGLALTYSAAQTGTLVPLPSWLTFDPATLSFTGTVPANGAELGIQVTAVDSAGASASETFAVLANQPSGSSTVQLLHTIADSTWQIGQKIAIAVPAGTFADPQGLALTYSASLTDGSALPSWLSVDPSSGNISGTAPPAAESISVRITAADSAGFSAHDDFLLNVPAPYAPELKDSTHDQIWAAGQSVNLTLPSDSFADPQGEALTYSATQSNGTPLPSWLHFNAATQSFSGDVPSIATSLTITVTATDVSNLTGSETFAVAISGTTAQQTTVVTGVTAQQAIAMSLAGQTLSVAITDSAANVGANLDALQTLASAGTLSSITLTDGGTPTLTLSAVQASNDAHALGAVSGNFSVAQTVTGGNLTISGVANAVGNEVLFNGNASQYTITAAGDGVHLSVATSSGTDQVSGVQALQFSDFTDIVAQTPGSGSSATSGNITELYSAVFGRLPDVNGLAYYENLLKANPSLPLTTIAADFLASPEYVNNPSNAYAQTTTGETLFISNSYSNLLHRAPETGALPYYLTLISQFTQNLTPGTSAYATADALAHAYIATDFSASSEFLTDVQVTAQNPTSAQHWLLLI